MYVCMLCVCCVCVCGWWWDVVVVAVVVVVLVLAALRPDGFQRAALPLSRHIDGENLNIRKHWLCFTAPRTFLF